MIWEEELTQMREKAKAEAQLGNEKFIARAPEEVVAEAEAKRGVPSPPPRTRAKKAPK